MAQKVGGTRQKPRVTLIGEISAQKLFLIKNLFVTCHIANDFIELKNIVHYSEIDLIIIFPHKVNEFWICADYLKSSYIISFFHAPRLPGPIINNIAAEKITETEEFILPDVILPFSRRRDNDLQNLANIRNWQRITTLLTDQKEDEQLLRDGAIILEKYTNSPLATIYIRKSNSLGVAWLPNPIFNQVEWIKLICQEWAKNDRDRFPNFGNWEESLEWMVPEEISIISQIDKLESSKIEYIQKSNQQIADLNSKCGQMKIDINKGRRRLLTA